MDFSVIFDVMWSVPVPYLELLWWATLFHHQNYFSSEKIKAGPNSQQKSSCTVSSITEKDFPIDTIKYKHNKIHMQVSIHMLLSHKYGHWKLTDPVYGQIHSKRLLSFLIFP